MSEKLRELGQLIQDKLNNEHSRRRWQAIIGVTFMIVFVVTSIVANKTVFAVNQAAGNYGYVSGTYGYNASVTSSDYLPSAPTSLSAGSPGTTTATLTWTAPTTTTGGTAIATGTGSISSYLVHYNTSSLSSCSGGSSTTSTSASASLTGLSVNTTYYVAVCAVDNNSNNSSALTGSFTTANTGGGGGGGGTAGSVFGTTPPTPAAVTTPAAAAPAAPAVTPITNVATFLSTLGARRSEQAETNAKNTYVLSVLFGGTAPTTASDSSAANKLAAYVAYGFGVSSGAFARGEREVAGVINDLKDVLGVAKVTEAVNNDKFFAVADAVLKGEGIKATKATRDIDYAAAFGLEKKLLPAFWTLTGIKPSEIVAAKGTAKYENFWEGFSKAVYAVRLAQRDFVMERKAIKFVKQRMTTVNRELAKQKVKTINTKSPIFWNLVRAVITIDQTNVKNLF